LFKLIFDILFAAVALLIAFPIIFLVMLLIVLIDFQNPIFFQQRDGKNKKQFTIIKLRTMKNNRITTLGNVFRKTGIDELPQLLNIISCSMSFVGPRPLTAADIARLGWHDEYHATRWNCKPGLTGFAQLSPSCNKKMSWFLDKKYIQCNSILLDLKILFSSFAVIFLGKKQVIKWMHPNR